MHGRTARHATLRECIARTQAACPVGLGAAGGWRAIAARRRWLDRDPAPVPTQAAAAVAVDPGQVRGEELARVEAVLLLAREPLNARRLAKLARLPDGSRARAIVQELRRMQEAGGSAVRVEQIAGGFQLLTRAAFGPWVRRLTQSAPRARLSGSALETLAIVAYRQPVTRAEIESIRGVGSEEMLRQLMERDYVAIGGRAEDLGRPNVYVTTRRFLAAFGLSRLEDLPPIESLAAEPPPAGAAEAFPDAETG
ncbi:MAG: SMC-Scp complex subunit ScpB [Planctomycetaceae bacterium]